MGTVSPAVTILVDGQATTTFSAGEVEGTAVITGTTPYLSGTVQVHIMGEQDNYIYLPLVLKNE